MGIFEALDLVPKGFLLGLAVGLDVLQLRQLVDQLAVLEDGFQQLPDGVVLQRLDLPGGVGIEDVVGLGKVDLLIPQAQLIGQGLAAVLVVVAVDALEAGVGNLLGVLADLDLGDDLAGIVLHSRQLINAAEHRLALGGNQPLAHAKGNLSENK